MLAPNPALMPPEAPQAGQQAAPGQPNPAQQPGAPVLPAPPVVLHDVTVVRSRKQANVKIEPVPPEEFGISRNARSIRDCDYCFHKVLKSQGELIAQGFDEKQIKAIPSYTNITNTEEVQRDTVNEYQYTGDEGNEAARRVEITEHYVRMDYEGNDKPCLYKVTTGGHQSLTILKKDGKLDIEECDAIPFAAMTPVIQTHRFFGRSIADLVMDIQRIKTALIRGVLDNTYLANNPRVEVAEQFASAETLDDLLVSRPGGIVRTKQPGGLNWQQVPTIAAQVFPVVEYFDQTRELRTGVTRQGQGIGADALQNQSATAVNQVFSASQARIRLIARIFAETGIRDLFTLIHATIRKHGEEKKVVRLRNQWVTVDPRTWKNRYDMTIHVGLGQGSKSERLAHIMSIIAMQKDALINGLTNLVQPKLIYNAAKEVTKLLGMPNVDQFFSDPDTQPPPTPAPSPEMLKIQLEERKAQNDAALEDKKAQAHIAEQTYKTQAQIAESDRKFAHDREMALLQHGIDKEAHHMNMALKVADFQAQQHKAANPEKPAPPIDIENLVKTFAEIHKPPPAPPNKGMRIVRDNMGRVSHAVPIE
jgi:hypothetical protein